MGGFTERIFIRKSGRQEGKENALLVPMTSFIWWRAQRSDCVRVPEGRLKIGVIFPHQPSLRDESLYAANPAFKRRATFGLSLWDNMTKAIVEPV